MKELVTRALTIALAVSIIGALFKLMHWPGANIMLIAGLGSVAICGIINALNEPENSARLIGIATCFIALGFLFVLMHWYGIAGKVMIAIALVAGIGSGFMAKNEG